jgi:hypothetical protein
MIGLQRILCWLGFHAFDASDLIARKRRAARMGVDVSRGLPPHCHRCGRGIWR